MKKKSDAVAMMSAFLEENRIGITELQEEIRTVSEFPDLGLRSSLFGTDAPFCETLPEKSDVGPDCCKIWMMQDSYACRYLLVDEADARWLVGPYLIHDISLPEIARLYRSLDIDIKEYDAFRLYYVSVPKLRDENMIETLLQAYCLARFGSSHYKFEYFELTGRNTQTPETSPKGSKPFLAEEVNYRYLLENEITGFIRSGSARAAEKALSRLEIYGMEARTGSSLRNGKNFLIVFNTLSRTAAREGGARPVDIDYCSRKFAMQIENSGSIQDLKRLIKIIVRQYCSLVKNAAAKDYSPVIQAVIDQIQESYDQPLPLKEAAAAQHISSGYLSALFKKEVGISFRQYVLNTRLSRARILLKTTDLPVQTICEECGIPDSNYFSRIFKSRTGLTPLQYRNQKRSTPDQG